MRPRRFPISEPKTAPRPRRRSTAAGGLGSEARREKLLASPATELPRMNGAACWRQLRVSGPAGEQQDRVEKDAATGARQARHQSDDGTDADCRNCRDTWRGTPVSARSARRAPSAMPVAARSSTSPTSFVQGRRDRQRAAQEGGSDRPEQERRKGSAMRRGPPRQKRNVTKVATTMFRARAVGRATSGATPVRPMIAG